MSLCNCMWHKFLFHTFCYYKLLALLVDINSKTYCHYFGINYLLIQFNKSGATMAPVHRDSITRANPVQTSVFNQILVSTAYFVHIFIIY